MGSATVRKVLNHSLGWTICAGLLLRLVSLRVAMGVGLQRAHKCKVDAYMVQLNYPLWHGHRLRFKLPAVQVDCKIENGN